MLKKMIFPGSNFSKHGILHNKRDEIRGIDVENNAMAGPLDFLGLGQ